MKERNNVILKTLDKYIGIPLVCIAGLLRPKKELIYPNSFCKQTLNFVVVKTAGIGDTVLLSAVIAEIKGAFRNSKVTIICSKNNYEMANLIQEADNVFVFNMFRPIKSLIQLRYIGKYDFLLDFAPWTRINSIISLCINAKYKLGFKRPGMYRHYVYDMAIEHKDDIHEIDNYRRLLSNIGITIKGLVPLITVKESEFPKMQQIMRSLNSYVVFHLFPGGSQHYLKEWPIDRWVNLGEAIYKKYGHKILLSGGKADIERNNQVLELMLSKGIPCESLAGEVSLSEICMIINKSKLLVTVDTGIMHLGAALNVKMISLHGPTSPRRWGPLSENSISVRHYEQCPPCISLGFDSRCDQAICMEKIDCDTVIKLVDNLFEGGKD